MPVPGELLGDRYRLDDRIAAGGMGEVWKATDTVLGRGVAVKTLRAERAGDPGFEERFRHEARAMAVLHHPGVADVYDFGQTGDGTDAYIVMARVDGSALNDLLAERGRLTPVETMSIVAQAGRALEAAHEAGIVHRDVKPGNLIIKPDGTVVLVDFGVARSTESAALTGAQEVVGTALYIAPEQVSKNVTGPAADIYALGAVAYHCLSGQPPFLGENAIAVAMQHLQDEPPPLPADVPEAVRALVARAMAKDPADRYPSAEAMAVAADAAVGGGTTTQILATAVIPVARPARTGDTSVMPAVLPPVAAPPAGPPPARNRGLLTAAIAVVALGVAAAVLAFVNPFGILPTGNDPETAPSTATSSAPGNQGVGNGTKKTQRPRTTTAPTRNGGPAPTTRPTGTPSATPSETPSQTPTETETTEPTTEPTTTTTSTSDEGGDGDNGGTGNDDSGNGGGDNSGSGGGEEDVAAAS